MAVRNAEDFVASGRVDFTRTTLVVLTLLLVTSRSRPADAHDDVPLAVALEYEVAPSVAACPSAQDFAAEVESFLGVPPFRADASLRVSVAIREGTRRGLMQGRVAFSGVSAEDPDLPWGGEQTIRASDCREIARTIALVVTVAVERLRGARARHVREAIPAAPPAESPRQATHEVTPAPRRDVLPPTSRRRGAGAVATTSRRPPAINVSSSVGALVAADMTPGTSVGTSFGARLRLGDFSAGLEGMLLAPSNAVSSRGEGGVAVSSRALALTACWHAVIRRRDALDVHACPVVAPLLLRGVGTSLAEARAGDAASLTLGGRLGAGIEVLSPFRLEVGLTALAPLTRHVFFVDQEDVWVQPALGLAAHLNISVRLR